MLACAMWVGEPITALKSGGKPHGFEVPMDDPLAVQEAHPERNLIALRMSTDEKGHLIKIVKAFLTRFMRTASGNAER